MIGGKQRTVGSRAEVWHGTAKKTSGGLTKSHLMKNKNGRIVSRKKHATAKKDNRLVKAGYGTRKGHFGYVMKNGKTSRKRGRKGHKGGMNHNGSMGVGSNGHPYVNSEMGSRGMHRGGRKRRSKKQRGGMYSLNPSSYSGNGTGANDPSLGVQFAAGNAG